MIAPGDRLLTPVQVAARISVSRSTVAAWFRSGILPGIVLAEGRGRKRVRRIFRISEIALDEWIGSRPRVERPK